MKIIDTFMFYNELDILDIRLHELYDLVDNIIIIEAKTTHSGLEKPLYFSENKARYSKYMDKIVHYVTDFTEGFDFVKYIKSPNANWFRENYQRECCSVILKKMDLAPDDVIISTDADEIPNKQIIQEIRDGKILLKNNTIYNLEMTLYYYNIELTTPRKWYHSKIFNYSTYLQHNLLSEMRLSNYHNNDTTIHDGGWHLSYYGDVNFIKNKVESFAESVDYSQHGKSIEHLTSCYNAGVLHFNSEKLIHVPLISNTNVPSIFKTH